MNDKRAERRCGAARLRSTLEHMHASDILSFPPTPLGKREHCNMPNAWYEYVTRIMYSSRLSLAGRLPQKARGE
jgi:hypothetical protein